MSNFSTIKKCFQRWFTNGRSEGKEYFQAGTSLANLMARNSGDTAAYTRFKLAFDLSAALDLSKYSLGQMSRLFTLITKLTCAALKCKSGGKNTHLTGR
jgi:hypothetical protein